MTKKMTDAEAAQAKINAQAKLDWESSLEKAIDFYAKYNTPDQIEKQLSLGLKFGFISQDEHDDRLLQYCPSSCDAAILRKMEGEIIKLNRRIKLLEGRKKGGD